MLRSKKRSLQQRRLWKWSTVLNGNAYDMGEFKKQVDAAYGGSAKSQ